MRNKRWNNTKRVLLFFLIALLSSHICVSGASQDDLKSRIDENLKNGRSTELDELGPVAIPYVLELLQSSTEFTGREFSLLWFVWRTGGDEADKALIQLLHHPSEYVRGLAAMHVGSRKRKEAVPELIALLQDSTVFGKTLCTLLGEPVEGDQVASRLTKAQRPGGDLLVKDEAVSALEETTGLQISKSNSFDKRARAWLRWWQKQKELMSGWTRR